MKPSWQEKWEGIVYIFKEATSDNVARSERHKRIHKLMSVVKQNSVSKQN